MRLTRILSINFSLMRLKEFRPKFQKNLAKAKKPSEFALEHFDFFYGPIYKNRWPSIRLGLLCQHKLCALINHYGDNDETIRNLKDAGAVDIFDLLNKRKIRRRFTTKNDKIFDENEFKSSENVENLSENVENTSETAENSSKNDENSSKNVDFDENSSGNQEIDNLPRNVDALTEFIRPTKKLEKNEERHVITTPIDPIRKPFTAPIDIEIEDDEEISYPTALRAMIFPRGTLNSFPESSTNADGVQNYYLLDAGTIFSVLALNLKMNDAVLDMCSAPGGTSLTMLQTLLPGSLVCNDVSSLRTNQARRTLNNFIPKKSSVRRKVVLKRFDASDDNSEWTDYDKYDKILVNVPSTNDRQSLQSIDRDDNLFRPSLNAERLQLPDRQAKLLKTALYSLRIGGDLIYSTSSLSPIQNDAVVETVLSEIRQEHRINVVVRNTNSLADVFYRAGVFQFYEDCRFGQLILPFLPSNFGPIYVCKMSRV